MKKIWAALGFLLISTNVWAVDFEDDVVRYGGSVVSVNRARNEITVRDSSRRTERTIQVEPRALNRISEGSMIDLPAVTSAGTQASEAGVEPIKGDTQ